MNQRERQTQGTSGSLSLKGLTPEQKLGLQSWLDHQLSRGAARKMARLWASSAEAQALVSELVRIQGLMRADPAPRETPLPREMYWRQICLRLEKEAPVKPRKAFWSPGWLIPVTALACFCVWRSFQEPKESQPQLELSELAETAGTYVFKDQSAGLTVVWVPEPGPFRGEVPLDLDADPLPP